MNEQHRTRWQAFWDERYNRWVALASVAGVVASLALLRWMIALVEARRGVVLADPVLDSITARDLTVPIFALIYASILLALSQLFRRPRRLLAGFQAYGLLMLMRAATLWLAPLAPPANTIVLRDPFVQMFLHSDHVPTKDLFFSGHVATTYLLFLTAGNGWIKPVLLSAAVLLGVLLALQHVHYLIDLVAAPFFAIGSYRAILRLGPHDSSGKGTDDDTDRA
jgi:hypothetical protein